MNQQQVNTMMAMNAAGGPVGGAPTMNNGAGQQMGGFENSLKLLNTYIYDYFLKNGHYNLARQIWQELPINSTPPTKPSPGRPNVNGVDDSMDTDSKDDVKKRPDDLPVPAIPGDPTDNAFLSDWWCQFWDIYSAHRGKKNMGPAFQYVQHTRQQAQMRNEQQNRMLAGNMPAMYGMMRPGMQNGVGNANEMQRKAIMNNRATPQQIQAMQNAKMMQQQNMARDGSNMDMSGQRPPTPGSAENAPSPTKRPRLDGGAGFNGQAMGPGGRSQPMQGPPGVATSGPGGNEMMLANGMNPNQMPPNQFGAFNQHQNMQKQQQLEVYSQNLAQQQRAAISNQMGKAMNAGAPQNSPMVQQAMDNSGEMFAANPAARLGPGQPGNQQGGGNHALQDYQMQLMLLEQQNKKRLLMARQEQDNMSQAPHGPGGVGQQGFAPAMSPSASRAGPSPNPTDQMKRGTPKLGPNVLPGSPMPDGAMQPNRASPIPPGAFDPSQMGGPGMPPQGYYPQMGPNMRPPSSHPGTNPNFNQPLSQAQMEQMRRAGAGQMPNGIWQQNPQMIPQNPNQPPPQQMGTPQPRNAAMPPPPAPQAGNEQQRTQPPSPNQNQQPAAPPTPSQSNKPNPKGKKERADTKKKPPKKGSTTTGATPASEAEPPTPATPNTPMHPNSFNKPQNGTQQPANGPQQQAPPPAPVAAQPPMDPSAGAPFGNIDASDPAGFDINFAPIDGPDVLENFDFDSFLHTDDNPLPFDATFGFGEVEAGMEGGQ